LKRANEFVRRCPGGSRPPREGDGFLHHRSPRPICGRVELRRAVDRVRMIRRWCIKVGPIHAPPTTGATTAVVVTT
jgi:hypothetical protein